MVSDRDPSDVHDPSGVPPECSESVCTRDADFFVYDVESSEVESREWRAICAPHASHLHPSLEVHAWLQSGYMKPVELGKPEEPPSEPRSGRGKAFRTEVEETMDRSG